MSQDNLIFRMNNSKRFLPMISIYSPTLMAQSFLPIASIDNHEISLVNTISFSIILLANKFFRSSLFNSSLKIANIAPDKIFIEYLLNF